MIPEAIIVSKVILLKNRSGASSGRLGGAQTLSIDVDDQSRQQDQAANQDLEEAVDIDVVKAVVEHAQHQQSHDGIADTAPAAEQAGAADHHGGNGIQQVAVELILLGAAEIGDADHAGDTGADGGNDHDGGDDQPDIDAGILRRLPVAADHVHV